MKKAVLCHENFAELVNLNLKSESYDFKCAYLYSDESMVLGNKATIVIQPRLYVNKRPANLDIIIEQKVKVITTNNEDITQTYVFD
jgi:hypothetical protein